MLLWRISRHLDLKGTGGLRAIGRWHYPGQPVVYLTESVASALLEVCVHTAANDIPYSYTLLCVQGPDPTPPAITINDLPEQWRDQQEITRELGTAWLRKQEAALLQIPSAIVPHTKNFLLNPLHPDAAMFRITEAMDYPFDERLKY